MTTSTAWGTKRNCPSCKAHFYDLNKMPAQCPKCKHQFDPNVQVRAKRRTKRELPAEKAAAPMSAMAPKKPIKKVAKRNDEDSGDALDDIAEIEDVDDIESLKEISEIEDIEESPVNSDDANEETMIDEINSTEKVIINNVEDEEAEALVDEIEDESAAPVKKSKAKPKAKKK